MHSEICKAFNSKTVPPSHTVYEVNVQAEVAFFAAVVHVYIMSMWLMNVVLWSYSV